jgi:phosphopantetheine--protein transferase-like protein
MENEIKKIYTTLSGGMTITNDNYIISAKQFNSISKDRFRSELKKRGLQWDENDISFVELLNSTVDKSINLASIKSTNLNVDKSNINTSLLSYNCGIDIQEISELPNTIDYWEDDFYKSKFSSDEIAYCVSKDYPKQSFSGLYSCKEAMIKCNNNLNWENINIQHDKNGKPFFENFNISISHSGLYSIAIAIQLELDLNQMNKPEKNEIKTIMSDLVLKKDKKYRISPIIILYILCALSLTHIIYHDFIK